MLPSNLRAAFAANDHVLTYEAVMVAGISPKQLLALTRTGAVVRVRQGVYVCGERWRDATPHAGRGLIAARAATLTMTEPHVLSHDSAAHAHGLAFLAPTHPLVHVTRERVNGSRTSAGVKHHSAAYVLPQLVRRGRLPVLDLARTAVDLVREHGIRIGLGACDSALRQGVTTEDLSAAAARMTYWRGITAIRLAIEWADPGADNPAESLARLLVLETGFGRPRTQFPVRLGDGVAWCDMVVGPHVVEFDGQVKYRRVEHGGVSQRDPSEVAWAERRRERQLLELGLGVSRLVWRDLLPDRWNETRTRVQREIAATWESRGAHPAAYMQDFAEKMEFERVSRIWGRARPA